MSQLRLFRKRLIYLGKHDDEDDGYEDDNNDVNDHCHDENDVIDHCHDKNDDEYDEEDDHEHLLKLNFLKLTFHCLYISIYVYIYIYRCMYVRMVVCMFICMYAYIYIYIYIVVCMYVCTYV